MTASEAPARGTVGRGSAYGAAIILGALVLTAPSGGGAAVHAPTIVVLVTIDTLRADHLSCYGYPRRTTPFIDSLAAGGVLFEDALTTCPLTAPAHAALFTGLHPLQHGVRRNGEALDAKLPTLASAFRQAGYEAAGFSAVQFLEEVRSGFDPFLAPRSAAVEPQAVARPAEPPPGGPRKVTQRVAIQPYRNARENVDQVVRWLDGVAPGTRVFVWLHLYDPHGPQHPPADLLSKMTAATPAERVPIEAFLKLSERVAPGERDRVRSAIDAYDAEVAFADRELGRLHEAMQLRGDPMVWVVTADHGEGLGDHGYDDHSMRLYTEELHVPLIVNGPGVRGGVRARGLVSHLDLWPTLVELAGLRPRGDVRREGTSLVPVLRKGTRLPERALFFQRPPRGAGMRIPPDEIHDTTVDPDLYGVQEGTLKMIRHPTGRDEIYDLGEDPGELRNLQGSVAVEERLQERADQARRAAEASAPASTTAPTADHEGELKSLGYVQ
ncbi:MAG: sulfatase-like hydrolase/transferase [Acidobacteriota bacterium]